MFFSYDVSATINLFMAYSDHKKQILGIHVDRWIFKPYKGYSMGKTNVVLSSL